MSIKDIETGEFDKRLSLSPNKSHVLIDDDVDRETGELDTDHHTSQLELLSDNKTSSLSYNKVKFTIPKNLIYAPEIEPTCLKDSNDNHTLFNKEENIHLQEEIILGCNKSSHHLFLLPSLFMCSRLAAMFIASFEIFLHIWAHYKDSKNTNPNTYYRSPLHIITSEFCGICRTKKEMEQVSKLHDLRTRNWRLHFRSVTRTMS